MSVTMILAWVVAQSAINMARSLAVREVSTLEEPSPMRKVIHLLEDMKKELEHEAENEAVLFDKAMCACETGEKNLTKVIEDATAQIAAATAKIETESAEHSKLKTELKVHATEKAEAEASLAKGAEVRESENKKFVADETEAANSIDQLDRAITALAKKNRGAALMQMTSLVMKAKSYLKEADRHSMLSFLGRHGDTAHGPGSDSITGILKTLHEEMSNDLASMRKTEQTSKDEYESMKAEKERQVMAAMKALQNKEQRKGKLALSLQDTQDALEDAQDELEKAQEYLAALQTACAQKEKDRTMRKEARNEEIVAINEAIKVMSDDDAVEEVNKALPRKESLLQQQQQQRVSLPVWELDFSFVQTAANTQSTRNEAPAPAPGYVPPQEEYDHQSDARDAFEEKEKGIGDMVQNYKDDMGIEDKGSTEKGRAAVRAVIEKQNAINRANWKPEKEVNRIVRGIVTDMSYGLHKTDVVDEIKFDTCTKEIATNEAIQAKKEAKSAELTSLVEKTTAVIEPLEKEIKLLEESINAQNQQVVDATAQRKSEHDEFSSSYTNMGMAIQIIKKGMKILEKFYRPTLLQRSGISRNRHRSDAMFGETARQHKFTVHKLEQKLLPSDWDEHDDSIASIRKRQHEAAKRRNTMNRDAEIQQANVRAMEAKLAPDWDDSESLLQVRRLKRRVDPVIIPDTPTTYIKKESGGVIGLMQQMATELKVDMKEAEGEENHALIDYQRAMEDAKMSIEADMKSLTDKRVVLARNKEQLAQYEEELEIVTKELKNLEILLVGLHAECDFITANYPAQHEARVDQDVSGKEIFKLIKHPIPSKAEVEQQFEDEKKMKDVAANFPNQTKTDE